MMVKAQPWEASSFNLPCPVSWISSNLFRESGSLPAVRGPVPSQLKDRVVLSKEEQAVLRKRRELLIAAHL